MSKLDPILNFRILSEISDLEQENALQNYSSINEGHTMITKTREAADSSEHSDTTLIWTQTRS